MSLAVINKNKKKPISKLALINLMAFMLGLQLGLVAYVISIFLEEQVGAKGVGWVFLVSYLISLYVLMKIHALIRRIGQSQTFFLFVDITWISLIGMGAFWSHSISIFFTILFLVGGSILWPVLDGLIETYSDDKTTGKTRGLFLTILNIGILLSPLISTWLVDNYENGFQLVFYLASFLLLIPLVILAFFFSDRKYGMIRKGKNISIIKEFLVRKNILRIYLVAFLLDLFYAVMVVYTPVYLLSIGLTWIEIGKIFAVMLIPFVILQCPLGVIADKKTGEKTWLIGALATMAISTFGIGFISIPSVGIWMVILLLTRIGAAIVEVMRDTYFYKKVGPQDIKLMDFYRTTKNLAYIVGMPVFGLLLIFLPLNYVFIVLGSMLMIGVIPIFRLDDTGVSG